MKYLGEAGAGTTMNFRITILFRFSVRTFFTDQRKFRNKNEIFNAEDRPDITMVESYRQKV